MPKKILIVDDEKNLVELVRVNMAAAGFDVITATDGEEGLKKASVENPDLIILDARLPKMDGWQTCRLIKNNPQTKNIPVIFLTASTQKNDIERAYEAGCALFLSKPFNPVELVEIAEKTIKGEK